jgi:transposase
VSQFGISIWTGSVPDPVPAEVVLSAEERKHLQSWARRPKRAQVLALRSRIVLAAADGGGNTELAARLGISRMTVGKWRARFVAERLHGLLDEPRPGRPRTVEAVITRTLETTPQGATHCSTRSLAAELGMSQSAVSRIWRAFGTDIRNWMGSRNDNPRPFVWTKTADQILDSIARYCTRINDSRR